MKKIILRNIIFLIIFLLDRFLKLFFYHAGRGFYFFKNKNIAFSLPFPKNILIILIIIILFFLFFYLLKSYQKKNTTLIFSLTLIILGTVSNLIDRLVFGFVIDYINISFFTVLNLADIMIASGVIILVFQNLFKDRRNNIN